MTGGRASLTFRPKSDHHKLAHHKADASTPIVVVAPALRGAIDASNLHVTHTEPHEVRARVYDSAGQVDSAAVH